MPSAEGRGPGVPWGGGAIRESFSGRTPGSWNHLKFCGRAPLVGGNNEHISSGTERNLASTFKHHKQGSGVKAEDGRVRRRAAPTDLQAIARDFWCSSTYEGVSEVPKEPLIEIRMCIWAQQADVLRRNHLRDRTQGQLTGSAACVHHQGWPRAFTASSFSDIHTWASEVRGGHVIKRTPGGWRDMIND